MLLKYEVETTPELRLHSFAIKKQAAPTLRLAADTEEAASRWATVIKEAIERNNQVISRTCERSFFITIFGKDDFLIKEETWLIIISRTGRHLVKRFVEDA